MISNKLHPASHLDLYELFEGHRGFVDEIMSMIENSNRQNFLMINTPFHLKDSPDDVFSQQAYFRDGGFIKYINRYLDDIRSGKTKLVFFFVDWWGFCNWKEPNGEINGNIVSYDIYNWLYKHCSEHGLLSNSVFVCGASTMFVKQYKDWPILEYNESFNRFFNHGHELPDTKTEPYGFDNFLFYLNRRARPHRVYSFYNMWKEDMLQDAKYTFHYYDEMQKTVELKTDFIKHTMNLWGIRKPEVDISVLEYMNSNSIDPTYNPASDVQYISQIEQLNKVSGSCYVEAICEYNCSDNKVYLSEKTARAMILKNPFVIFGDRYTLTELKRLGFKTFSEVWDESYDTLETAKERIDAAIKLLKHIKQTHNWRNHYNDAIEDIVKHNRNWYYNGYKQKQLDVARKIFE